MQDKDAVGRFLREVKETITKPPGQYQSWVLVPRPENKDCMAELGFRFSDIRDVILGLSVADYCEGPVSDHDRPGDFWVFGKMMDGREVYIKLKLASLDVLRMLRVVSFHFAKEPICYPFK